MLKRVADFLWGKGGFFDMGDRYPVLDKHNESTIPIYLLLAMSQALPISKRR